MANKNKAQMWTIDLIIGIVFFAGGLTLFFLFNNTNNMGESKTEKMYSEAKTISDYLLTDGYPDNWTKNDIIRIGVTSGDHILNVTKLEQFSNMTQEDYVKTKILLAAQGDYLIYFEDKTGQPMNLTRTYMGKPGYDLANITTVSNSQPNEIIKVFRYLVHKKTDAGGNVSAEIIKMVIIYWE